MIFMCYRELFKFLFTRMFWPLFGLLSSSCGGLVALRHILGALCPLLAGKMWVKMSIVKILVAFTHQKGPYKNDKE